MVAVLAISAVITAMAPYIAMTIVFAIILWFMRELTIRRDDDDDHKPPMIQ